jgi:valyl-tRNA synthetase
VETLAKAAGDAVRNGDTTIHPASLEPRWFGWVDNMHDWCISRQLWWGHRIPIWYGPDGEMRCIGPDETAPDGWVQDPDVLDTWFSSGLWPFSTMGWPDNTAELDKFYPTSVLVTGYDILFFWVARMMMFGLYVSEDESVAAGKDGRQVPFTDVFLHGLIRDQFGKKMSKSRGNGIDPLDWVSAYGADALRFTLARGAQPGSDLSIGESHAAASRNFVTKLFNAVKFALMNGATADPSAVSSLDRAALTDADRWILGRLDEVLAEVDTALDRYEFGKACESLFHFTWDEVCDWYLELAKVQFNSGDESLADRTRAVLGAVLESLLRLLHPVMPFVTESLWQSLTGGESVVIASWPQASGASTDTVAAQRIADTQRLVTEVRRFRSDQGLKDKQKVAARLIGLDTAGLTEQQSAIASLAQLTPPGDDFGATASVEVRLSGATVTVEVDTSGTVDLVAERRRMEKDLAAAEKELAATTAKLGNEAFLAKAPDAVVDKIRGRKDLAADEVTRLKARLEAMGAK